ncbi:MAG: hypothetical protein QXU67_06885, partial [Candidatus Bathyarchaeia archaeon]
YITQYTVGFCIITFMLNPFLWKSPIAALKTSLNARRELLTNQVNEFSKIQPTYVLRNPSERVLALIANLYIIPPAIAEVENYRVYTAQYEEIYQSHQIYHLFRSLMGGSFLFTLTIFGMFWSFKNYKLFESTQRKGLLILFIATLTQALTILVLFPLPWQRYVIPLIPLTALWISLGLTPLFNIAIQKIKKTGQHL